MSFSLTRATICAGMLGSGLISTSKPSGSGRKGLAASPPPAPADPATTMLLRTLPTVAPRMLICPPVRRGAIVSFRTAAASRLRTTTWLDAIDRTREEWPFAKHRIRSIAIGQESTLCELGDHARCFDKGVVDDLIDVREFVALG